MPNNFTFFTTIPATNNSPSSDQPKMLTNNQSTASLIGVDHIGFNLNGSGIHKQVTLQNEAAPGLGDGAGVLYANLQNGQSWPFWQNALGSVQMLGGVPISATNGYTFLPGSTKPIIVQWGYIVGTHGGDNHFSNGDTGTVTFAAANIAFPTNLFGVWANPLFSTTNGSPSSQATIAIDEDTFSKTKFGWRFVSSSSQYLEFFWVAIGN